MSVAFASVTARIRELGQLSAEDIASATGASPTTVWAWLRNTRTPTGAHADRLLELSMVVERLSRVIGRTYVPLWLRKPIPLLDDEKPIETIARGDYRRVSRVISGLESPAAS